jgi:DNA-binding MarR family transcriptional regulator
VSTHALDREAQIEEIARFLPRRGTVLARLLYRHSGRTLPYAVASLLASLIDEGPRRITQLAEHEGLSQPAVTQLVARLEREGLARRDAIAEDGRATMVSITDEGAQAIGELRDTTEAVLRDLLSELSDRDLKWLYAAGQRLQELIEELRERS